MTNSYFEIVDPLGPEGVIASAQARNVEPFEASVLGYNSVVLSWESPALGAWLGIQIVRSRSGFPRTPDDGEQVLLFEQPGWNEQNSFDITNLTGGYHYFSLFLRDAFGWQRAADVDALVPYYYGSTDRLWDNIPEYYRSIRDDTADLSLVNLRINADLYDGVAGGSSPNLLLSAFISLFGWGFDLLRTQAEYLAQGYDPNVVHISRLNLLAKQFGHEPETSVPAHTNRTIVRNLATLYRNRGTLSGIKDSITAVSGWDVEVNLGQNMMLSEDQAAFVNPEVPVWSPTVRYLLGERVEHGDFTFEVAVANTLNSPPPITQTSNATWTYVDYPRPIPSSVRADTGDVGTWQARVDGLTGDGGISGLTIVAVGAPDITGAKRQTNVLRVARTGTNGSNWLDVLSAPSTLTNPTMVTQNLLEGGIPIPRPTQWSATRQYEPGEFVVYKGAAYESLNVVVGVLPTVTADWLRVGHDDRIAFTTSTYAHGPFTGTAGTGGKTVRAKAVTYTSMGEVVRDFTFVNGSYAPRFDPFVDESVLSASRPLATGQVWASDGVGNWMITRDDSGGQVSVPATGKSQRYLNAFAPAGGVNVAVTFTADPGTTRLVGIVFRRSGSTDYWIATQTGLYKVVAGAARANPASGAFTWTKFTTGQRMRVLANGNDISVYRNGTLLGTATDSFNASGTDYGLGTEA